MIKFDETERAAIQALEEKYFDLVWFARKRPEDYKIEAVASNAERVEQLYPDEVGSLSSEEEGSWQHGFNSGMLAAMRFVMTMESDGVDAAHENFPELDT